MGERVRRLRPIAVLGVLALFFSTAFLSGVAAAVPAQAAATTSAGGQYVPLVSTRIVSNQSIEVAGTYTFSPLGKGGIPATGVSALAFQLHAMSAGGGWLQVFPAGVTRPGTSTVNYAASTWADNSVVTGLGTGGQVSIYNGGATLAAAAYVDVIGYYTAAGSTVAGSTYVPLQPDRIVSGTAVAAGGVLAVSPLGQGGIPSSGVTAVVAFVSTNAATSGHLISYPAGVTMPATSDLNYGSTDSRYTAEITVKLGTGGKFNLETTTATTVYLEVAGYFQDSTGTATGSVFTPVTPARVVDHEVVNAGATGAYTLTGVGGVPSTGVSSVVFNLTGTATAVGTAAAVAGALSVNAADQPLPVARQLSYHVGSHWPTLQAGQLSSAGQVAIHNTASSAAVTLLADVTGYYTPVVTRPSGLPWSSGVGPEHGDGTRLDRVNQFTDFRGAAADDVVVFPTRDSWDTLQADWNYDDVLPAGFQGNLVVSVPMWPGSNSVTDTGTQADWQGLAQVIAGYDPDAYIRLGWEMNLGNDWALTDGNEAGWQADFIQAVQWMKAVEPGLRFVWNPNKGGDQTCSNDCSRTVFQAVKNYVDVYGIDSYDSYPPDDTAANQSVHLNDLLGESLAYATANGKKFAVPEWGVACTVVTNTAEPCQWAGNAGGDNPQYINDYVGFFAQHAGDMAFEAYFDDPDDYLRSSLEVTPIGPNAPAAYKADILANVQ
jgi:hypothetical protein